MLHACSWSNALTPEWFRFGRRYRPPYRNLTADYLFSTRIWQQFAKCEHPTEVGHRLRSKYLKRGKETLRPDHDENCRSRDKKSSRLSSQGHRPRSSCDQKDRSSMDL